MMPLVQVELALHPLTMISHHSANIISYPTDTIFIFSENHTRLISDCMSLLCESWVSLTRKLGACDREALWAKWSVWLVWSAQDVQQCLCCWRPGAAMGERRVSCEPTYIQGKLKEAFAALQWQKLRVQVSLALGGHCMQRRWYGRTGAQ